MKKKENTLKNLCNRLKNQSYKGKRQPPSLETLKKAWSLYMRGWNLHAITKEVNISHLTLKKYMDRMLDEYKKENFSHADRLLSKQAAMISDIVYELREAWELAKGKYKLDDKYMIALLKALEEQRKILGFDKPQVIEVKSDVNLVLELSMHDRIEALKKMMGEAQSRDERYSKIDEIRNEKKSKKSEE
jgi:hypothetical protein